MTEKQYARKVGQVVASRLGIIMGRGKLMVRLLAGSKWARPVRQEGGAHNVSRGICVKQKVFHILTVVLRAETDNFDDNGFSDPTVEFTLYDCKTDRKITKSFSIGTNSKDEFRYETDLLATLVRFVEQNPFLGAEISR
ncbi:MAG: hypothetical protein GY731_09705 [Gammaproteobacteria bacterium]|nr:hypothetical protein [Gammaproteobacteria bacterium]